MEPAITLNWAAVAVGVLTSVVIGFLWWGPLFGKLWAREMHMPADFKPTSQEMLRSMVLQIFGAVLTTYVLAHDVLVWRPSVWNAGNDKPDYVYGCCAAFFVWLGYYIPQHLGKVAWERKSWTLFFVNAGGSLVSLFAVAMILTHWR